MTIVIIMVVVIMVALPLSPLSQSYCRSCHHCRCIVAVASLQSSLSQSCCRCHYRHIILVTTVIALSPCHGCAIFITASLCCHCVIFVVTLVVVTSLEIACSLCPAMSHVSLITGSK